MCGWGNGKLAAHALHHQSVYAFLGGLFIFLDKNATYVDVEHLEFFSNLDMVDDFT